MLSSQLAEKGLSIERVYVAKEAALSILTNKESASLVLEIQLERGGSQSDVDSAILSTLQKLAREASGKDAAYEFFRDHGLKRRYESGGAFTIPVQLAGGQRELNFKIINGSDSPCIFSVDCFQIEATSLLLGRGGPPSASAAPGYDYHRDRQLAMRGQFEIQPEGASKLQDGAFEYIRLVTGRNRPLSLRAEAALFGKALSKSP